METYAGAALTSMGYMLMQENQERSTARGTARPSATNIYDTAYLGQVHGQEQQQANNLWQASQVPQATGVVPAPAYSSMFGQSLTGEAIAPETFVHNNMQPFYRGSVKQNVDPFRGNEILERHTGQTTFIPKKREAECFFEPTANVSQVCGMANNDAFYKSRIVMPTARRNDFPLAQEHVGPGLGMGYTTTPSGGFHQANTLDYVRPKNVDELRAANDPKITYELPVQGPKKGTAQRGAQGVFSKNRPDTYFENTPDKWLKTTGAVTAAAQRPDVVIVKPTSRVQTAVEYEGQPFAAAGQPGRGANDDYGKSAITVFDTERSLTSTKTVVTNVKSMVSAMMAPLLDSLRRTPKEYLVDAARIYGNMSPQIPEKATIYDPVTYAPRTTNKETLIHDVDVSNLHGPTAGPVTGDDDARKTGRETLPVVDSVRNVAKTTYKVQVYNVDEVAKRTHRETTGDAKNPSGNIGGQASRTGAYTTTVVSAPMTQKAFVSAGSEHYGSAAGTQTSFFGQSLEAWNNAEIDGSREMMQAKAGYTPNAKGASAGMDAGAVRLDSQRPMADDLAARSTHNPTRVLQTSGKAVEQCEVTRQAVQLPSATENRLDPNVLSSLKTNPYAMSINPIVAC